jgi:putative FmdB family regulatory protein
VPTYSYVCNHCGASFDVEASITEKKRGLQVTCPQCSSRGAQQVLNDTSVLLRRSGGGCCEPSGGCCGPSPNKTKKFF